MFFGKTLPCKYYVLWTLGILSLIEISKCAVFDMEPVQCCFSKFDYDYKVMEKLLQFETKIAAQAREIEELKQRDTCTPKHVQKVAFMAQLSESLINPQKNTVVVFDIVHTNVGHGYKSGLGTFIAPLNGTYNINVVASSRIKAASELFHLYIMHNTSRVGYIFLDQNTDYSLMRTTTVVLQLKAGDTVFVKAGNGVPRGRIEGCCFHTLFSGFLIN